MDITLEEAVLLYMFEGITTTRDGEHIIHSKEKEVKHPAKDNFTSHSQVTIV